MHSYHYKDGKLYCENVDLSSIAEKFGTPTYVYSKATLTDHYTRLDKAMDKVNHLVCYAVKANSNLAVINTLAKLGSGFDIVSAGELFRVIKAGGDPSKCTFAGVGKTRDEIRYALDQGIYSFNVESLAELEAINEVAGEMGKVAPVALRVNPNVDAKTHKYISTGKSENKFGIDFGKIEAAYEDAATRLKNVSLRGLQMHIGSQLTSIKPFLEAVRKVAPLATKLKENHGIEFFSIGGGIGIVYHGTLSSGSPEWWQDEENEQITIDEYAATLVPELTSLGLRILLEPGRMIAGNAGALLTRVLYTKKGDTKTFQIVDAGMGDLIRPALYEGHHEIAPVAQPKNTETEKVDIVGPICESGDFFVQNSDLPPLAENDLIALLSAGAYGFTMASNYNSRPFPAEIMVDGDSIHEIRKRQSLDDLIAGETMLP